MMLRSTVMMGVLVLVDGNARHLNELANALLLSLSVIFIHPIIQILFS